MEHTESQTLPPTVTVGGEQVDQLFSVLAHRYRRYTLQRLQTTDRPITCDQLAIELAARKEETPMDKVSLETARQISIPLHHTHLPKLAEASVIDYDGTTGKVVPQEQITAYEPFLERVADR